MFCDVIVTCEIISSAQMPVICLSESNQKFTSYLFINSLAREIDGNVITEIAPKATNFGISQSVAGYSVHTWNIPGANHAI